MAISAARKPRVKKIFFFAPWFPNISGHGFQENFVWSAGELVDKQFETSFRCIFIFCFALHAVPRCSPQQRSHAMFWQKTRNYFSRLHALNTNIQTKKENNRANGKQFIQNLKKIAIWSKMPSQFTKKNKQINQQFQQTAEQFGSNCWTILPTLMAK